MDTGPALRRTRQGFPNRTPRTEPARVQGGRTPHASSSPRHVRIGRLRVEVVWRLCVPYPGV